MTVRDARILALLALALGGCVDDEALARGAAYVEDRATRRAALEASLVTDDAGYATLRLAHYGVVGGWEALPVWDPPVRPVVEADLGLGARPATPFAPVFGGDVEWTEDALLELGARAFETYPVQPSEVLGAAIEEPALLARHGLEIDRRGRVGGVVRVAYADGTERFAFTCATCHSRVDEGERVLGAANVRLDYGRLAHREGLRRGGSEDALAELLAWGPGRADVTPDDLPNPAAFSDLRAVRHHPYLHWSATLENDLIALAIRIETLIITSMGNAVRPPREVAFAIALYLWRLGEVGASGDASAAPDGAAAFERACASCHGADGTTPRGRLSIEATGTDPMVGLSPTRGTGFYRVPSLWGVGDRPRLLHDASVGSLEDLLDPARLVTRPGHDFGTRLDPSARAALARFVRTIGRAQ